MTKRVRFVPRHRKAETPIGDFAAFRRRIHQGKDLIIGLSQARACLERSCVIDVAQQFCRNPTYKRLAIPNPFPESYDGLRSRRPLRKCPNDTELLWGAAVLESYAERLNDFFPHREAFTLHYLNGRYQEAAESLDETEKAFGCSFWSLSSRLTLTQSMSGVAAQKEILSKLMSASTIGAITGYIAFMLSYSIEDGVSLSDLRRDIGTDDQRALDGYTQYLRYHVSPFEANFISNPIDCIWLEDGSSLVDRLDTFTDMLQIYLHQNGTSETLVEVLRLLSPINDLRVKNLAFCLDLDTAPATCDPDLLTMADMYTEGKELEVEQFCDDSALPASSAWLYEIVARSRTHSRQGTSSSQKTLREAILSSMTDLLRISEHGQEPRLRLEALGLKVRQTAAAKAIAALLDRDLDPIITSSPTPTQTAWYLSGPLVQPQGFRILEGTIPGVVDRIVKSRPEFSASATIRLLNAAAIPIPGSSRKIADLPIPMFRKQLYTAYAAFNRDDYPEALSAIEDAQRDAVHDFPPQAVALQYALLKRLGRLDSALKAFSDSYLTKHQSYLQYPMRELAAWAISKGRADDLSLPRSILLHAYSTYIGPHLDGDLSDAFEDVLDFFKCRLPSSLCHSDIQMASLRYFLRHISTIGRLEDTTRLTDLYAIEAERIKILQWLVEHDVSNKGIYTAEIGVITKDQEVARLSAQFERSKIYVHEEGVRRVFSSELRPIFERYRQLLADPRIELLSIDIEGLLKKLLRGVETEFEYLLIPSTERDSLYFSMMQRAYDSLVLDPIHGLKTYLSTRVLHGVLEGEMRSSFVAEDLLVSYDSKSKNKDVEVSWSPKLLSLSDVELNLVGRCVSDFSDTIVSLIAEFKDKKIRIFSREMPNGLFAISLEDDAYRRLKESLTPTVEYDEFVDRLIATFWDSIEACLRDVRAAIAGDFTRRATIAFDHLERSLVALRSTGKISELSDAIARCRAAFSYSAEKVASWFVRSGVLPNQSFDIERAIEVATLITNNCYPRHPIKPKISSARRVELNGALLNPVVDLLTNCLQNASEHCGFQDMSPQVEVVIQVKLDGFIEIRVINDINNIQDLSALESEMRELASENDVVSRRMVALEGRTGLRKMKRILRYDLHADTPLLTGAMPGSKIWVQFTIPTGSVNVHTHR